MTKIYSLVHAQFGTLIVTDSYEARGMTAKDAQNHLSFDYLLANILSLATCLSLGYLSDKVKIYKILNVLNILLLVGTCVEIYRIHWFPID